MFNKTHIKFFVHIIIQNVVAFITKIYGLCVNMYVISYNSIIYESATPINLNKLFLKR